MINHNIETLKSLATNYRSAYPFPHIIIDNFLKEDVIDEAIKDYPSTEDRWFPWRRFHGQHEEKFACSDFQHMPTSCQKVLSILNSQEVVDLFAHLSGIENLFADHSYLGGGLHQIKRGGLLDIHLDFNRSNTGWRRLNALLFANPDWREEYSGHTELWETRTKPLKKVLPIKNRLVLFSTSDNSWHGHPNPLTCPDNMTRKSFATYYYSDKPSEGDTLVGRDTTWK
jgi:Rps23 Pro-64 3,4-dihydroxylase Tpa1-like proline 4-hydroxylase